MKINYQFAAESLIDMQLSDYRSAVRDLKYDSEAEHRRDIIISRLASLVKYEELPLEKIIRLAQKRNDTFSFLTNGSINIEVLTDEINQKLNNNKW